MKFSKEIAARIEARELDKVEELWVESLSGDMPPVDEYLTAAKHLRKAGERSMADTLLELLAEALLEADDWVGRLKVLKEIARLSKKSASFREPLEEALNKAYGSRPNFDGIMRAIGLEGTPGEKAEKIETWLTYDEGGIFFMAGRGIGVVVELNPELGVARVDFEKEKRFPVPLGAAPKYLEGLSENHILRRKITDPEALRKEALSDQSGTLEKLLRDFGRPMMQSEIRDAMSGVIPDAKWTSWWTAARKHQQIVMSGKGAKATYSWQETTDAADEVIRRKFKKAKLPQKRLLAKRHAERNEELAMFFAQSLANEAIAISESDPGAAWETLAMIEKLPVSASTDLDEDDLLLHAAELHALGSISDRTLRERAIRKLPEIDEEWVNALSELFFSEEDARVLDVIMEELHAHGQEEEPARLIDETLRYPRRHRRQFYWYCRWLDRQEGLRERADLNLIYQMLELISVEESATERTKFKEFFDKGGLAIRIAMERDDPEEARRMSQAIERHGQLEEYRREILKSALRMRHASLQSEDAPDESIVATAASVERKRKELEQIKRVDIPANLKALQEAREMGDLRENFEYKSARQRQEYLSSRAVALTRELSNVRVLDPSKIDTQQVRAGTKVKLRGEEGAHEITILGPWESDPDRSIYSHESEAAQKLIGSRKGDTIDLFGRTYVIDSIGPWE